MEKYDVLSVLGKGGCGKVVLAKEKESGKLFAIKEVVLDPKKKMRTKEAVIKEASILAHLKHPHVVSLLDSFFDPAEEQLHLVQDFCDGGTLYDQIVQAKEKDILFPERQVMQWFVQLTMALQYIHSRKVLHRDLKSQNVFLTKKGVVKLGDFGIARMMENTLDMAQTCCGTPCYLSPELCQDLPYSSKADMWALGCLLFEMCALRYAFDASNFVSLFYKIVKVEHGEVPERYSSSIRDLIKLMLAKSPEDRPTAGAILNLPYVQENLVLFIKEKENLQEALHAKQLLKTKEDRNKTPDSIQRPSSALAGAKPQNSATRSRCKSAHPQLKSIAQPSPTEGEKTETVPTKEADDGGTYSDDFDESSEEEYSDDFEEDPSMNDSLKRPVSSITNNGENGNKNGNQEENVDVEYADDFEQDSDNEEVIDDILENARAAQDAEVDETVVEDEEGHACRQKLKEHVMEALGVEMFEKVKDSLGKAGKEGSSEGRPEFEKLEGSALLETCYIVNALFLEGE